MKKLTVLSGKGGVGKSSITASLALLLAEKHELVCADCDVDASNLALVLGVKESEFDEWKPLSTNKKAKLIEEKCTGCKECVNQCYFNAIEWSEEKKQPVFNSLLCEGCGVCKLVCPENAIELIEVENAKIGFTETKYGFGVVSAQLKMGESGSGKVVAKVKELALERGKEKDSEIMLVDAAAGIGCPVIASVVGSDFVIAVTEPTPSGLADLKRVLGVVKHFGVPFGIVVNKFDLNQNKTREIEKFASEQNTRVLSKIPYNKSFVDALVNLTPVIEFNPWTRKYFEKIIKEMQDIP